MGAKRSGRSCEAPGGIVVVGSGSLGSESQRAVKSPMRTPPVWVYKPGVGSLRAGENLRCDSQARF